MTIKLAVPFSSSTVRPKFVTAVFEHALVASVDGDIMLHCLVIAAF